MQATHGARVDSITAELPKADITTTVDVLHDLFCVIWDSETVPTDWSKGLIVRLAKNWRGITLISVHGCKSAGQGVDQKNIRWR